MSTLDAMDEQLSDDDLMQLYCKNGDATAFTLLYHKYKIPLYRYLMRQCRSRFSCDELYQEIWLKIMDAHEFDLHSTGFRTFLFHIAHNRLIDYFRTSRSNAATSMDLAQETLGNPLDYTSTPAEEFDISHRIAYVMKLVQILPQDQKEVFLLKQDVGLTLEEISVATTTPMETVKSRLLYATQKLRRGFKEVFQDG